jgi:amino acid transporter
MLFRLSETISAILAMRIMIQFIGQAIGLLILRSKKNKEDFPYKMPLFPLPVIVAIIMWLFILISTGTKLMIGGLVITFLGGVAYIIKAMIQKEWPFINSLSSEEEFKK